LTYRAATTRPETGGLVVNDGATNIAVTNKFRADLIDAFRSLALLISLDSV